MAAPSIELHKFVEPECILSRNGGTGYFKQVLELDDCKSIGTISSYKASELEPCPSEQTSVVTAYLRSDCTETSTQQRDIGQGFGKCYGLSPFFTAIKFTCEGETTEGIVEGGFRAKDQIPVQGPTV